MKPIFTTTLAVRDYELDSQGIVNNANYLHYLELARHDFCEAAGYSFAAMSADGINPVVRRAELDYISSLRMGDRMEISVSMERRGARFVFRQHISRLPDHQPVLDGVITIVCIENGTLSRGDRLAEAFREWLVDK
ncbi:MAG: acyl-CoA thioesterase [Duncaniella sp.]|nr:acyl-CoA thioesterase [Duncaniella sp.]